MGSLNLFKAVHYINSVEKNNVLILMIMEFVILMDVKKELGLMVITGNAVFGIALNKHGVIEIVMKEIV